MAFKSLGRGAWRDLPCCGGDAVGKLLRCRGGGEDKEWEMAAPVECASSSSSAVPLAWPGKVGLASVRWLVEVTMTSLELPRVA